MYSTGVPSTTQNLIDSYISFLVSYAGLTLGNTWTFQSTTVYAPDFSGTTLNWTARALGRDGQYILLAWPTTAPDRIALNSATVNPTSGRINAATGSAANSVIIELGTAPVRYHFFGDGNSGHAVVEWIGGCFQHINVGYVEKYDSFTGGIYVTGTMNNRQFSSSGNYGAIFSAYNSAPFDSKDASLLNFNYPGHVRADFNGFNFHSFGSYGNVGGRAISLYFKGYDASEVYSWLLTRSPNSFNGRAILIPTELLLASTDDYAPASWVPLGRVSNCAMINIANLDPGQTILTDWMVFPWSAKNSGGTVAAGYIDSKNYGMAYKK